MVKRYFLSNKDIKELSNAVGELGSLFRNAKKVEVYELNEAVTVYIIDDKPLVAKLMIKMDTGTKEYIIPLLTYFYINPAYMPNYPVITVDDGAVPHIVNGADVMRPGIKEISGNFNTGDVLLIRDLKGRYIAIGVSLMSVDEMRNTTKGKVIKVIHHLNDKLWSLAKELIKQ
ncbi:DUF1947 domain-containing protein [Vulcanisaeta souniana]|uniref:RNA-binding protein n=1 Tax=Vulcanisaeta souniana JCM 11219 TaxID=1293586 RepID=A0A830E6Z2_9CREN|nr:DUF1947 domain-containing protein [Vulcanisaeta souniana]BDR91937.1 RNA-binding protein [Vulcanisaeta souniana JCM 11219]GGI69202.1 RNA-binding protein [Vulcanisaeta souniana JCM 11219]